MTEAWVTASGRPFHTPLRLQPARDPLRQDLNQLAAVRRRRRISQPFRDGFRFLRLDRVERATGPAPVVAIAQQRLDGRVDFKSLGGLIGPQSRARRPSIRKKQATRESGEFPPPLKVEWFIGWKSGRANGGRRSLAEEL